MDVKGRYNNVDSARFSIRFDAEVNYCKELQLVQPSCKITLLALLIIRWTRDGSERPPSGSLVKLVTEDSQTRLELL